MPTAESFRKAHDFISLTRSGDDDAHIWEQLPDEGAKAYAAFFTYLELGPHIRSIEATAKELGKSPSLIGQWSSNHHWVERSKAYDSYIRRQRYTVRVAHVIEMEDRHAQIGQTLMRLGLEALSKVEPERLTSRTALAFITQGIKVERLAARLPTDILDIFKDEPRDISEDFSQEELLALAEVAGFFDPTAVSENEKSDVIVEHEPDDID